MPRLPAAITPGRAAHLAAQGGAIAYARGLAGFTQRGAAEHFGASLSAVQSWENGLRSCPAAIRHQIVEEWGGDAELLGPGADVCPHCGRKM